MSARTVSRGSDRRARPARRRRRAWLGSLALLAAAAAVVAAGYVAWLSRQVGIAFEGRLWKSPSRVYSAPLEIGLADRQALARIRGHLEQGNYAQVAGPPRTPGQFSISKSGLDVYTRDSSWPGRSPGRRRLRFVFQDDRLASIKDLEASRDLVQVDLEPQPIASIHGMSREERTILPLSAFPKRLIEAVLAAEDRRFFDHHGVDPIGVVRALFENLRSGAIVQGGSTITQQTVKSLLLTHDRSIARKLKEALLAVVADARYSKERILEVYLNEIYLGQRGNAEICGFGEASRFYFGKEARDLDLAESALLSGMIRAPSLYNPITHPERAFARKNAVIQALREQGRISEDEALRALRERPAVSKGRGDSRRARYFVDRIRLELSRRYSERELNEGGMSILTTLDTWMQEKASEALERGLERLERARPSLARRKRPGRLEGCLIALRPRSGEVVALVGGRNYGTSQFDRATQARRQPGSLFKPFVFAAGFERGRGDSGDPFTPATLLEDEPISMKVAGKAWHPQNYDGVYRGTVTARDALEQSLNVPTVQAALAIGLQRIADTAEAAGMGRDLKPFPSLALGAQEVTPLDAAAAFATFANGGRRPEPFTIAAVRGGGRRGEEYWTPRSVQVVSAQSAYLTLDLLRGVVDRGTGSAVRSHGITGDLAGKTGTTNDKRDAWFVGFRPNLLVLVWVGFDDRSETFLSGAQGALPIWVDFMRRSGEAGSHLSFEEADGIIEATIDPTTGGLATSGCRRTAQEIFSAESLPDECSEHAESPFLRFWRRLFGGPRGD